MAAKKRTTATKRTSAKRAVRKGEAAPNTTRWAGNILREVEKASDVVLDEVRDRFNTLSQATARMAKVSAEATSVMKQRLTSTDTRKQFLDLVGEIEEVGESLLGAVTQRFEALRSSVVHGTTKPTPKPKAKRKKKAAKKRPAASKKVATKKKAAKKKTVPAKKAAKRETASTKKAAKKKATARKRTA